MSSETQAPWIAAAVAAIGATARELFKRGSRRDDVIVQMLVDCEKRHDERDGEVRTLREEVTELAIKYARLEEQHSTCDPRIKELERQVHELRKTDPPPRGDHD